MNNKFVLDGKTVLISGGAGSIGSEIVKRALSENVKEVNVCDIDEIRLSELSLKIKDNRLKTYILNIRDCNSIERMFNSIGNIEVLFHVAAMKHVPVCEENPIEATLTNIIGTQNMVDAALRWSVKTAVLISTDKAVNPKNVMGATKFIAERIFLNAAENSADQKFFIVRFGNVANSRGSVIPVFIDCLLTNNEIIITDSEVTRFIMRIPEAVELIFKSLKMSLGGEIFVLKMPAFRLGDLLDGINQVAPALGFSPSAYQVRFIGLQKGEKKHEILFGLREIENVVDLEDLYAIIDVKRFEEHNKYLNFNSSKNIISSSQDASKIPLEEIKKLFFEHIDTLRLIK